MTNKNWDEILEAKPPKAEKETFTHQCGNISWNDDYQWLRDENWPDVKNENILNYIKQENNYSNEFFEKYKDTTNTIFEEIKGRIKLSDQSVPIKYKEYFYYKRTEEDKDYPIYCRKHKSMENQEEVVLDQNKLAENKKFFSIGILSVSPSNRYLAYSFDDSGDERFTINVFDLQNGGYLQENIEKTIGPIVWHEYLDGFFYLPLDDKWRHQQVYFHKLGTPNSEDILIYNEEDELFNVDVDKSSSKDYIFLSVQGHNSNEIYVMDMKDEDMNLHKMEERKDTYFYSVDHRGDYFYIHSNHESEDFGVYTVDTNSSDLSKQNWKPFIKPDQNRYLEDIDLTINYLILNYKNKSQALPMVKTLEFDTGKEQEINFPEEIFDVVSEATNFEEDDIRVYYSSLKRPSTTYRYDFENDNLEVLKEQEIPSGFNPDDYEAKREWAQRDGVYIPISVVYKKDLFKGDGSNPLFIFGYGSYGAGMDAGFRNNLVSLLDRGFVFAIAHIRGGDDKGFGWHEDAKFLKKKNTFEDFIACTEDLIEKSYTSTSNIAAFSGSAGGMLMGYLANQRPDLYKTIIAHVPFVDVLHTMLDESLPLTPGEFKEWGNPKEEGYFEYMASYCPYQNIKNQNYPNIYSKTSIADPRVGYWEAAKWVAKLRENKTDNNLLLLKTDIEASHGGASGRFDKIKERAQDYTFILATFDIV